jgi:hypothetical protein
VTECQSAVAGDLSTGGVNLLLSRPFLPGSLLTLELEGAGQETPRWLMIWVLHVTEQVPGRWLLGCTFDRQLAQEEVQNLLLGTEAL